MRGIAPQQNKQVVKTQEIFKGVKLPKPVLEFPKIPTTNQKQLHFERETPPAKETPGSSKTDINCTELLRHTGKTFFLPTANGERGQVEGHHPR